ncbi:MAG TPA: BatD family protein [Candidatus Acidoferrales bacterium]|nr:BatD family protein [Candidatus Acidoferrales bacterium]
MKMPFKQAKILAALCWMATMGTAMQDASAQINATLDPGSIALGESAQLTVTLSGSDTTPPEMPAVNGLQFTPTGQSSSFQSINGAVTSSVTYTYQVTPDHAGTFTIPAIQAAGGAHAQAVTLQVTKSAGNPAGMPPANLPPPNVSSGVSDNAVNASGKMAFLRVVLPKQELYVGELVPVQVKAYLRDGMDASLNGPPALSSDAFTLDKLDAQPEQSQVMIGGQPYTLLSWSSTLGAVKSGDYTLDLQLPVIVREHQRGHGGDNPFKQFFGNSPFGNSPFDNSFFNDPDFEDFFGNVVEKPITLRADVETVEVLPLPLPGRPANFSGAVGRFEVSSQATPTQLTAGDPITLRFKVSGEGNFDRVYAGGLNSSAEWKTYSTSAKFDPADSAGYSGTKTFEQAVIPLKAGSEKIPPLVFSYFDPDKRQYVTRTTTPIAIEVAPGSGSAAVAVSPASSTAITSSSVNSCTTELAPNKVETGSFVSSLQPVLFQPWFIASQSVPVMALAAAFFIQQRRQRLAQDPQRELDRAAHAAMREQLTAMEQALGANSAPAFFTAARQVVQQALAWRWQLAVNKVTAAELARRLNGRGDELRHLFAVADDVLYSGRRVPQAEMERWKKTVTQQLEELEEL